MIIHGKYNNILKEKGRRRMMEEEENNIYEEVI
jgi:hypothetical protein